MVNKVPTDSQKTYPLNMLIN